jgi:hypothetical protein
VPANAQHQQLHQSPKCPAAVKPKVGANVATDTHCTICAAPKAVVVATLAAAAPPAIAAAVPAAAATCRGTSQISCSEIIFLFSVRVFEESYSIINFILSNASCGLYCGCTIIFFYYKYIVINYKYRLLPNFVCSSSS